MDLAKLGIKECFDSTEKLEGFTVMLPKSLMEELKAMGVQREYRRIMRNFAVSSFEEFKAYAKKAKPKTG